MRSFITIAATLALVACSDDELAQMAGPADISYSVVAQGVGGSSGNGAQFRLVESQAVLESLFYSTGQSSDAQPPVVDFGQDVAFFATLGSKPTSGYAVSVEALQRANGIGASADVLEAVIESVIPGPQCLVTPAITEPYVIIAFPRESLLRGVINLSLRESVDPCRP